MDLSLSWATLRSQPVGMWDVVCQRQAGRGCWRRVFLPSVFEGRRPEVAAASRLQSLTSVAGLRRPLLDHVLRWWFLFGVGSIPPHFPRSMKGSVFCDDKVEAAFGLERCHAFESSPRRPLRARFRDGDASAADLACFSAPRAPEVRVRCWSLCPPCVFTCNVSSAAHSGLTSHRGGLRWH